MPTRVPDRRGVPVTTSDPRAAEALDRAVDGLARHRADTPAHLQRALALDEDLAVAHALAGFAARLLGRRDLHPAAALSAERARASIARRGASPREERIVLALERWCAGDPGGAVGALEGALALEPLDLLALKLSHAVSFLLGRIDAMRASLERVLPAWERARPDGLGPVLGCHAFALEESGELARAEDVGRRAIALDPIDPWGAHAVAHVLHTTRRARESLAWLEAQEACLEGANNFAGHVAWHRALALSSLGRHDEALALHDARIATWLGRDWRDLASSATLLYRLERAGVGVGARWDALADLAEQRLGDHALGFADVHHVLALRGARRHRRAEGFVRSMERAAAAREGIEAEVLGRVAVPAARAIAALDDDPRWAHALLSHHEDALPSLGGSRAQREIFELVREDAAAAARRGAA